MGVPGILILRLILATLSLSLSLHATTYYVSNSGADTNAGTSTGAPWANAPGMTNCASTCASTTLNPGDSVLLQAGGAWRETWTPTWSGNSSAAITYGSYGSGAKPIVSGANVFSSWTSSTGSIPSPVLTCTTGATSTSLSCTGTITTSGSMLILSAFINGSGTVTVSDTKGNTWLPSTTTSLVSTLIFGSFGQVQTFYVAANNGSGSDTFTFTFTSSVNLFISVAEWAGQAVSPLDGVNESSNNGSGTALSSGASTGSAANTDLVFAVCTGTSALTVGSGFTSLNPISTFGTYLIEYEIAAGNSLGTCVQSTSGEWAALVATFKSAAIPTIYFASYSTAPNIVLRNGSRLTQVASKAALVTGTWWLDTSDSEIWIFDNPSGATLEAAQRANGIVNGSNSYTTFSGIQVEDANTYGFYEGTGGSSVLLTGMSATNNFQAGVRMQNMTASEITRSTLTGNGYAGISVVNSPSFLTDHVTANSNCWSLASSFCGGIKYEPGSPTTFTNAVVQYSIAEYNGTGTTTSFLGAGVWADTVGNGLIYRYNTTCYNNLDGLFVDADNNAQVYGNVSCYNGMPGIQIGGLGIDVTADSNLSVSGNVVTLNTVYGNYAGGINVGGPNPEQANGCTGNTVQNNVVFNSTAGANLVAWFGCENPGTNGSGNIYTYNSLGVAASNFIIWGGTFSVPVFYSTYASWEAATGNCGTTGCSHSMQSNPLLTNTVSGDFRPERTSPALTASSTSGVIGALGVVQPSLLAGAAVASGGGAIQ